MSNYYCNIKIKKTGEIYPAEAIDDYFGRHQYGYITKNGKIYRDYEVEELDNIPRFTERKPYNPPLGFYKKASMWNKIVWKIKNVIKLLIK